MIPELKKKTDDSADDWMITYADAITLLLAFFIMLMSFSTIDANKFENAAVSIKNEIGNRDEVSTLSTLKVDMDDIVYQLQMEDVVSVGVDRQGLVVELASKAFYRPGSVEILDTAVPTLRKIAETLLSPRYQSLQVDAEGHTDDEPIQTERFPSNWELSAGRATEVVRFFIGQGVNPQRLKATGFAETRPKVGNRTAGGEAIPENQAKNRRVTLRIHPLTLNSRLQTVQRANSENQ